MAVHPLMETDAPDDPFVGVDLKTIDFPVKKSPLEDSYNQTIDLDPDHAAKVLKASKALGENPQFIDDNFEAAQKAAAMPSSGYFAEINKKYPVATKYLSDPEKMAVTKDDIQNLVKNEELVKKHSAQQTLSDFGHSLVSGIARGNATLAGIPNVLTNLFQQIRHGGIDPNTYSFPGSDTAITYWTDMANSYRPDINEASISEVLKTNDIPLISKTLTSKLIEQAPSLALLLGASAIAGPGAGMGVAGISTASDIYERNRNLKMEPSEAATNALYHGTISAAFMNLGSLSPIHAWEAAIAPKIGVDAARKVALDMVKTFAASTLNMAGVMGAMTVGGRAIDVQSGIADWQGLGKETLDATIEGGFTGLASVAPFAMVGGYVRAQEIKRVKEIQQSYSGINENMKAQALYKRAPEMATELLGKQLEGSTLENIGIPEDKFQTYFQSQGVNPEDVAKTLGIEKQLESASGTGTDLSIPLSKWAAAMGDTPHYEGLKDDIRFGSGNPERPSLTINEAKEIQEVAEKGVIQQADQAIKEDPKLTEGRDFIIKDFSERIKATGQLKGKEDAIKHTAEILAAQYIMAPWRKGQDLKEFYLGSAPEVKKAEGPAGEALQQKTPDDYKRILAKQRELEGLKAAVLDPETGEIYTGDSHIMAAESSPKGDIRKRVMKAWDEGSDEVGFVTSNGEFVTRQQASRMFGVETMEDVAMKNKLLKDFLTKNTDTPEFKNWFGESKVVKENGDPLVVYHGTGNAEGIGKTGFSYEFVDKGNDQLGSGFYFTDQSETASGYTSRRLSPDKAKIGGETSPAVLPVYLSIKKPIEIKSGGGIKDAEVKMSKKQLREIVMKSPDIKSPDGPLSNWGDVRADGFEKVLAEALPAYKEGAFSSIGNDFFPGQTPEFLKAVREVLGYDGVVTTFPNGEKHYVAWFPEQIKSIFNKGTFDPKSRNILNQGNPDNPRAFITMGKKRVINLVEGKADASSIVHELGHDWLENFHEFVKAGLATEDHLADWGKLKAWLKFSDDQKTLTREQHEKFAKGYEAYLMEGVAPKEELRTAFQRFSRWLTKLYGEVRNLGVELTPEIRGVFDRMLASQEEIDFAHRRIGMDMELNIPGLDPKVKARLVKLREDARNRAIDELTKSQMEKMTDEHRAKMTQEAVNARVKAEDDIKRSPVQTAMKAVAKTFGKDAIKIAKKFHEGKMLGDERASLEVMAEARGFESAGEMVYRILQEKPVEDQIRDRVKAHMDQFPEFKNTPEMEQEALKIVHDQRSTELLAQERAIFQDLVSEVSGRVAEINLNAEKARLEADAARVKAKTIIANKPVSEAGQYMPYFTAERNAAIKSAKALINNDFNKAAESKRVQMLNHALASEAMKARKQIERWNDYLDSIQTKDKALFKQEQHFNQVASILDRFGLGRQDYDPSTRTETLSEWNERMIAGDEAVSLAPWLMDESIRKPFKSLSVDQAHDMVNAIKNIQRIANAQQNFYRLMDGANIQNTIIDLSKEAAQFNVPREAEQIMRRQNTVLERAKKLVRGYDSNIRTIENIALKMGGWKDGSKWVKALWEPIEKAADIESNLMKPLNENYEKLLKDHYSAKERRDLVDYSMAKFVPELNQSVRKIDLLMMALNTGNQSNRQRLFESPIIGLGANVAWSEKSVMTMLQKNLTVNDWKFVQGTWDLINSLWPKEVENHKEITGFTPTKVDPMPFSVTTADGKTVDMAGGYFPLKSDTRSSIRSELREKIDDPLYTERNPAWKAVTKTGHLQGRQEGAKYPVALDSSIIQRHLRDAVHDIAFRSTVIDLRRLIGNQQFADTVKTFAGDEQYKALRDWVGSVANGNARESTALSFWEGVSRGIRQKYTSAVLMFNPKIVTQNLSNAFLYAGSAEGYGWEDAAHAFFSKGVLDFIPSSLLKTERARQIRDMVYNKSAFMRDKGNSPEYSIQQTFDKLTGGNHKLSDFFYGYFSAADELTSIPNWLTAYEKKIAGGASEPDAVMFADTVIRRSIGAARKYETAPIFRGGEMDRTFATFQGFMNAQQNRWERERGILSQNYGKNAPRFAGYVAAHFALFAAASNLLSGNLPDFSDEDKMKKWMKSLLLYKFQMLPGINAISSVVADHVLHIPSFGYRPIPQADVINKGLDAIKAGIEYAEGAKEGKDVAETASHAIAYATGQPDQFVKILWNAYDIAFEDMKPKPSDVLNRRPKSER